MAQREPKHKNPFVGRVAELEMLEAAIEAVSADTGRIVFLSGEPGIGKTRVATEIAVTARNRGFSILNGRCHEGNGAPLYWPWIQIIRSVIHEFEPDSVEECLESGASVIAEIDSHIRRHLSSPPLPSPTLDPMSARFRLFDSISTFLGNISEVAPLLIVFDDLQWADRPSLELLDFFVHHGLQSQILLLCALRDIDAKQFQHLQNLLGGLAREPGYERIIMRGLDVAEIRAFLPMLEVVTFDDSSAAELYNLTDGNPLFVQEIIRACSDSGGTVDVRELPRIPTGIREVIGRRLNRLSAKCNEVLEQSAVIGTEFEVKVLARLGRSGIDAIGLLEEAVTEGVVEVDALPGRYRFDHNLTRLTMLERLSTLDRKRLHAEIAEALVNEFASQIEDHLFEIADHFYRAGTVADPNVVLHYLIAAGEYALSRYAHREAIYYFEKALDNCIGDAKGEDRALLLAFLGRAYAAIRDDRELRCVRESFGWYETNHKNAEAADVAGMPRIPRPGHSLLDVFDRALRLVPEKTIARARILNNIAHERAVQNGDIEQVKIEFDVALEIAEVEQDPELEMRILADRSKIDAAILDLVGHTERSRRVMRLARVCDNLRAETIATVTVATACVRDGKVEEGVEYCRRAIEGAERLRDISLINVAYNTSCSLYLNLAMWDQAREAFDRISRVDSNDESLMLRKRAFFETETGNSEFALNIFAKPVTTQASCFVAVYAAQFLLKSNIRSMLEPVKEQVRVAEGYLEKRFHGETPALFRLLNAEAMVAYFERDRQSADRISHRLEVLPKLPGAGWGIDRTKALLATASGRKIEAIEYFDLSIEKCRSAGYVVYEGWDRFHRAEVAFRLGDSEHARKTSEDLTDLIEYCRRWKLPLLEKRVADLLETAKDPVTVGVGIRSSPGPDGLTPREIEVLRLVTKGCTNREIGNLLNISSKTVGNHLQNLLKKTGSANRTEAAAYAIRNGIDSELQT